ncbi:MAG: hypothetical protein IPJ58_13555 [Ardenticatenia bacterium]|nr:hypothetical protein [Ardenticatenia bacterium]
MRRTIGAALIGMAGVGLFAAGAARPVVGAGPVGPAGLAGPRSPARAAAASPCPAGALLCEDFEDTDFAARGWYDGPRGVVTAAEHAPGSGHAFECTYARGATGCEGGTPARHAFDLTESLYVEYWVKYAPGFVGSGKPYHPHEYVFMTNKDGPYIGPAGTHLTTYVEQLAGRPRLALQDLLNVDTRCILRNDGSFVGCDGDFNSFRFTERRSVAACNGILGDLDQHDCFPTGNGQWYSSRVWDAPAGTTLYGGDWHRVAARFKLNSIAGGKGLVDGTLRYWLDGRLVISYDHILYRTAANADQQFNQLLIAPYIGDGSPLRQTMWIDDLRILRDGDGGGDPGPTPTAPATPTAVSTVAPASTSTATRIPTTASTILPTASSTPTMVSRPTATPVPDWTLTLPFLLGP